MEAGRASNVRFRQWVLRSKRNEREEMIKHNGRGRLRGNEVCGFLNTEKRRVEKELTRTVEGGSEAGRIIREYE